MWIKYLLLSCIGLSFGAVVAGGVFTVFTAVGLIPRFADKTNSAEHILSYENMVIAGTFLGDIVSLFPDKVQPVFAVMPGRLILLLYGLFTGMYVGCLALSIAEIMDAIPIMARRVRLRRGIGIVIIHFALGKMVGSLLYYKWHIFNW